MSSVLAHYQTQTSEEVIASLAGLTAQEKYEQVVRFAAAVENTMLNVGEWVERIWGHMKEDEAAWRPHHESFEDLEKEFPAVRALITEAKRERNRLEEARVTIIRQWGVDTVLDLDKKSLHELRSLRKVAAQGLSYEDAVLMGQHAVLERVTNPGRGISKSLLPSASDWTKVAKGAFPAVPVDPALLRKLHLVLQEGQLFRMSDEMVQELEVPPGKILSPGPSTIESVSPAVDPTTSSAPRGILSLSTPPNLIPASREPPRLTLPRAAKRPRPAGDEETETLPAKRPRSNDVCSCRGPSKDWLDEAEGGMIQYDYASGLYLAAPVFYASWSLCAEHLDHLLQHLGMFPVNDKSEAMAILRQAWARRYDYLIFKAEEPDLFQASGGDEDDDDDGGGEDER
jgi:hypothetical protein